MSLHVILLMGGFSSRFGGQLPKQFQKLVGKRVYQHSLDTFLSFDAIESVVLVVAPEFLPLVKSQSLDPRVCFAKAGLTRQSSSKAGLDALKGKKGSVIIHDAARPFVSKNIIHSHIETLKAVPAVNTCIPSADTIVVSGNGQEIDSVPLRSTLMRGQTPQSFHLDLINKAHRMTKKNDATDDCQLVLETTSIKPAIVLGETKNMKITYDLDMTIAEHLLRRPTESKLDPSNPHFSTLQGKIFAVTGGTGGIGTALIKALQSHGAAALCIARSSKMYPCDLTNPEQTKKTFDAIYQKHGSIDGLIHTAGALKIAPFHSYEGRGISESVNTNLLANLYVVKYAHLKKGAHVLNFASSAFYSGRKNYVLYSACKAAIVNFTQGLALERPDLFVNALVPYRTNTAMRVSNFPEEDPAQLLSPEQVANQALHVLTSSSTGGIMTVKKSI